jgi:hypothetical protein
MVSDVSRAPAHLLLPIVTVAPLIYVLVGAVMLSVDLSPDLFGVGIAAVILLPIRSAASRYGLMAALLSIHMHIWASTTRLTYFGTVAFCALFISTSRF